MRLQTASRGLSRIQPLTTFRLRVLIEQSGVCWIYSELPSMARDLSVVEHSCRTRTRQGGDPEATVVCGGRKLSAHNAALINGTYAHSTELFESFTRAMVHPGDVVIPAVMAVAERDVSGASVVAAIAVGYEILSRIGLSVGLPWLLDQGFHTPRRAWRFRSQCRMRKSNGAQC